MKKKNLPRNYVVDFEKMEKWLTNYFLDPSTTHCDLYQFRIDIYETETDWIVEASLDEYVSSEIKVKTENTQLVITAQKHSYTFPSRHPKKTRTIDFPFSIINHCITASFQNNVLEIFISKINNGSGKNRYITLP